MRRSLYRMKAVVEAEATEVVVMGEEVAVVATGTLEAGTALAAEDEDTDTTGVIALSRRWEGTGRHCRYRVDMGRIRLGHSPLAFRASCYVWFSYTSIFSSCLTVAGPFYW